MISDELENELRGVFARSGADIAVPQEVRTRLLQRDYRPRSVNRGLAAGLTAAVAAAGIAIPLAVGAGSQSTAAGPKITLASYTFRMPAGYKRTAATSAACQTFAAYATGPNSLSLTLTGPGTSDPALPFGRGMSAAASSSGGCIVLVLAPAYTPTAAAPDPEAPSTARPVQVGSYHGLIFDSSISEATGRSIMSATELYVELPVAGGRMRDLVIGTTRISKATLIKIAADGLSS